MNYQLGTIDTVILILYGLIMVAMGIYFLRKTKTSEEFMVAGRGIPAWAAGIAVMSAYTSSISYIAVPGKAFDDNWHPLIFALTALPVAWFVTKYVIPHYRKHKIISVYKYLEEKIGDWGRIYASFSFVLFMVGRTAVILYLSSLLLTSFIDIDIRTLILIIGVLTIAYTLMGGMEAVIWTDVLQSIIMIGGLLFSAYILTTEVFSKPDFLIQNAFDANKFSLGDTSMSLSSRTILVMVIYGVTENIRNLMADQNYTQKYSSVATEKKAKRSVWIAMLIYLPLTAIFLYIGTAMFAFYAGGGHVLDPSIIKGDEVFPYFIATELPVGLKGLIIAAILAASMSTVDSALNSSATVLYLDYYKKYFRPNASEKSSIGFLRWTTVIWGILGIIFSLLLINAKSALDIWWQISGIFGGGILGLFLLAIFNVKIKPWQGITAVVFSILIIIWGTFLRNLSPQLDWLECTLDPIIIGAVATAGLIVLSLLFAVTNKRGK
ncbi:sodium/solute symporter [Maribacter polysiphoniae]|uniref:SSS family solute:Na+ symporter n=1 Tax=Maribacter polysiphoniae TaxID=429344 RepID=A0A316E2F9_9FLAO|nr:sodium/solute symporter [Maribacter polysiphoniae]MBD1261017.1 sodium/solute symporter [Maribacter polysiphoniae]PWK23742.1 SSS family solute:Na+ symporter [Maribacter polysiphoniae]